MEMISLSDLSASLTHWLRTLGGDNIYRCLCKVFRYGKGKTDPLRLDDGLNSRLNRGNRVA